ncbi:hypothetical protein ZWY2020_024267 [Hordeum vulgare]|nr:hypothetical protein ZWY2020_024267 [Hordeum vulgare]
MARPSSLMYRRKQRGFLELDLVLGTWVEQHVRSMDETNIRSLLQILDLVSHPALPDPSSFHRSTAHIVVSIHTQWADLVERGINLVYGSGSISLIGLVSTPSMPAADMSSDEQALLHTRVFEP